MAIARPQGTPRAVVTQRLRLLPASALPLRRSPRALTDEQDGEGDEEQEDVRHHVERVHEATVVEDALVHPVGGRVVLAAAEGQGHGGAGQAPAPAAAAAGSTRLARSVPRSQARPHPAAPPRRRSRAPTPTSLLRYPRPPGAAGGQTSRLRWDREFRAAAPARGAVAGGRLVGAPAARARWGMGVRRQAGCGWAPLILRRLRGAEERRGSRVSAVSAEESHLAWCWWMKLDLRVLMEAEWDKSHPT